EDPGDDGDRVGPQWQGPHVPDGFRWAGDSVHRVARTPRARSVMRSSTAPSAFASSSDDASALTAADPTMTPSAWAATWAACSALDTPRPTHTRGAPAARQR